MTHQETDNIIGVDVCKATLDIHEWGTGQAYAIPNTPAGIVQWLARWTGPLRLALEPTNTYHRALAEAAHAAGHAVYLLDPYRLAHYRQGVGERVKADPQDAELLARYLAREAGTLRVWAPLSEGQQRFVREFHAQVLADGALPLAVLEAKIDRWIKALAAARASGT